MSLVSSSGQGQWVCNVKIGHNKCGKKYKSKSWLEKHIQNIHVSNNDKNAVVEAEKIHCDTVKTLANEVVSTIINSNLKTSQNNDDIDDTKVDIINEGNEGEEQNKNVSSSSSQCIEDLSYYKRQKSKKSFAKDAMLFKMHPHPHSRTQHQINRELADKIKFIMTKLDKITLTLEDTDKLLKREKESRQTKCVVCWDKPNNYAFIPCGHKTVCGTCAVLFMANKPECPLCRRKIYDIIQIWD
jgi:hypothetical protein